MTTSNNEQQPEKPDFVSQVVKVLSDTNRLMRSIESLLIDLIAATAPWLAPILPAYMVYHGLSTELHMPAEIAWVGGIITEFLGLSAISTTMTLWDYNDRRREAVRLPGQKGRKSRRVRRKIKGLAPVWVAAGAGLFYLAAVLVVNVLLDTKAGDIEKIAKALLSSLSVIAALILTIRGQHARRLEAAESRRKFLSELRKARKDSGKNQETFSDPVQVARKFPDDWRKLTSDQKRELSGMTAEQIAEAAGISLRSGWEWHSRLKDNGFH